MPQRKLTPEQENAAREMYATGLYTLKQIAEYYGLSRTGIRLVVVPGARTLANQQRQENSPAKQESRKRWKQRNKEKIAAHNRLHTRKKNGVVGATDENKSGPCEICTTSQETLHLDHCHKTGRIRGWLCGSCNRGLGLLKEDAVVLLKAFKYLQGEL